MAKTLKKETSKSKASPETELKILKTKKYLWCYFFAVYRKKAASQILFKKGIETQ